MVALLNSPTARRRWIVGLACIYAVALTTSMAAMEIAGSLLTLLGLWEIGRSPRRFLDQVDRVDLAAGALAAAVLASLACSTLHIDWGRGAGPIRALLGFVALKYLFASEDVSARIVRFLKLALVPAALAGAYALFQHFTALDPLRGARLEPPGPFSAFELPAAHATGFFSSSMTFGNALLLPLFLALGLALQPAAAIPRGAAIALAGAQALGLFAAFQRGPWLGAIAGVVALHGFLSRRAALVSSLALVTLTATVLGGFSQFALRLASIADLDLASNLERVGLWRAAWRIFRDHPALGVGFGHLDQVLPEYFARLGIQNGFVSHAHNNVMDFLAGAGLFAALSYLALTGLLLAASLRVARKGDRRDGMRAFGVGLFCGQVAFFVAGFTECNFTDHELTHQLLFWGALACAAAGKRRARSSIARDAAVLR